MSNTAVSLVSLDFDDVRDQYKAWLRTQDQFKDYDFDGSNISVLIDLLALNTNLNGFFLNMTHAERFLDSAQMRSSLVSKSKELNYLPRSARSADANITVSFQGTDSQYLIRKGSSFSAIVKNQDLLFTVPDNMVVTSSTGSFSFTTPIYEGSYFSESFVVSGSRTQRFVISNPGVDTRSVTVVVYEPGSVEGTPYLFKRSLLGVTDVTRAFFMQASETGQYEIIFGDDVIGKRPQAGSHVVVDYRVTQGEAGNGARVFSPNFSMGEGTSGVVVTTNQAAKNGAPPEDAESIRYYAPRHYQVQERAVVAQDYALVLKEEFPEINAVAVYGGEDASPPQYGKVFISVDISGVEGLPTSKIDQYQSFLRVRTQMRPIFVDPERVYFAPVVGVDYNINTTTLSPENMSTLISAAIIQFNEDELDDFEVKLRGSKLDASIQEVSSSILGVQSDYRVYKKIRPSTLTYQNISVEFGFPLREGYSDLTEPHPDANLHTITTSPFRTGAEPATIEDDGAGNLWVVRNRNGRRTFTNRVGTVDYESGEVTLQDFLVDSYDGNHIKIYARVPGRDVEVTKHSILSLEPSEISVTVNPVRA